MRETREIEGGGEREKEVECVRVCVRERESEISMKVMGVLRTSKRMIHVGVSRTSERMIHECVSRVARTTIMHTVWRRMMSALERRVTQ